MKNLDSTLSPVSEGMEQRMIGQIQRSELFQNYERAFVEATGLPLRLAVAGETHVGGCDRTHRNPFCELLARNHKSCEACTRARDSLTFSEGTDHHTSVCFAGLCESCVPIRTGGRTIGYLLTGEIATEKPTQARFAKIVQRLSEWGVDFDESALRRAYFSIRCMSHKHYRSILELLNIFAGHLSLVAGQLILRSENSAPPDINRACTFINEHLTEPLDLKQVADSANLSICYFCRKFKESTGLTFTAYVARTRVEAAKKLLLNPQVRISEVAFEVGFQSLTHFNRVFKEISGLSPTQYRESLPEVRSMPGVRHLAKTR